MGDCGTPNRAGGISVQRGVWPFKVVAMPPVFGHVPNLGQAVEDVAAEYLRSIGPVKAFEVGVWGWFSWLNEDPLDSLTPGPVF
jgi:hypothetical protein